jgi:nucleotidyltransferase/DNA polymerase involved in DNA repair
VLAVEHRLCTVRTPTAPQSPPFLVLAAQVRREVWEEVGVRCSAGVAHNKLLAKLGSAVSHGCGWR